MNPYISIKQQNLQLMNQKKERTKEIPVIIQRKRKGQKQNNHRLETKLMNEKTNLQKEERDEKLSLRDEGRP